MNSQLTTNYPKWVYWGLLLVGILFYGSTLKNDYGLDDHLVMVNNPRVQQGVSGIPDLFTSFYSIAGDQQFGYRPVTQAVFALEYEFFGANPAVSHGINLLLYLLTIVLLLKLLRQLFKGYHWVLPALVVTLFVIHPIHAEVVNNVKCRDELLSFIFGLLALKAGIGYARKGKVGYLFLALGLMVVSLLAKMSTLTFLALIPLTLYFFENLSVKRALLSFGVLSLSFVAFRALGRLLLVKPANVGRNLEYFENPLYQMDTSLLDRIPAAAYTMGFYFKELLAPYPLLFYYGYDQIPIAGWSNPWAWLVIVVLVAASFIMVKRIGQKEVWVYGGLFLLIGLSMYSNLVRPAVGIVAERFAYVASLGFSILMAYGFIKLFKLPLKSSESFGPKAKFLAAVIGLLVIGTGIYVNDRNLDWKDELTLVKNDIRFLERSAKANALYADFLVLERPKASTAEERKEIEDQAIYYFKESVKIYPSNGSVENNLGVLYFDRRDFETADVHFEKARALGINSANSLYNFGMCKVALNKYEEAIELFDASIMKDPNYFNSYSQLSNIFYQGKVYDKALTINIVMVKRFPGEVDQLIPFGIQAAKANGQTADTYLGHLLSQGLLTQNQYNGYRQQYAE